MGIPVGETSWSRCPPVGETSRSRFLPYRDKDVPPTQTRRRDLPGSIFHPIGTRMSLLPKHGGAPEHSRCPKAISHPNTSPIKKHQRIFLTKLRKNAKILNDVVFFVICGFHPPEAFC